MIKRIQAAINRRINPEIRQEEEFKSRLNWLNFKIEKEDEKYFIVGNHDFKNVWLRKNSSDLHVFEQVFLHREYESLIMVAKDNKINVHSIVDAGANIGLTSLFFLHHFPEAKIISIEPDPENYEMLKKNTQEFGKRIVCLQMALWDKEDVLEITDEFGDGRSWAKSVRKSKLQSANLVKSITVSQLISDQSLSQIDIFKMDIEGAEEVIFAQDNDVSFLRNIKIIGLEIHDQLTARALIIKSLTQWGFFITQFRETSIGVNFKF